MPRTIRPPRILAGRLALLVPAAALFVATFSSARSRPYELAAVVLMALLSAATATRAPLSNDRAGLGGAGSDPSKMRTSCRLDGNHWVIDGAWNSRIPGSPSTHVRTSDNAFSNRWFASFHSPVPSRPRPEVAQALRQGPCRDRGKCAFRQAYSDHSRAAWLRAAN